MKFKEKFLSQVCSNCPIYNICIIDFDKSRNKCIKYMEFLELELDEILKKINIIEKGKK
jgi:hypothetical protein